MLASAAGPRRYQAYPPQYRVALDRRASREEGGAQDLDYGGDIRVVQGLTAVGQESFSHSPWPAGVECPTSRRCCRCCIETRRGTVCRGAHRESPLGSKTSVSAG